jgi:hypothetical protein
MAGRQRPATAAQTSLIVPGTTSTRTVVSWNTASCKSTHAKRSRGTATAPHMTAQHRTIFAGLRRGRGLLQNEARALPARACVFGRPLTRLFVICGGCVCGAVDGAAWSPAPSPWRRTWTCTCGGWRPRHRRRCRALLPRASASRKAWATWLASCLRGACCRRSSRARAKRRRFHHRRRLALHDPPSRRRCRSHPSVRLLLQI